MSERIDYGEAYRFQAGAVGDPGNRTFYVYVEVEPGARWFLCEKGQVAGLAEQSLELLNRLGRDIDEGLVEMTVSAMRDLPWPTNPDDVVFRIGSMGMRLGEETMTLILEDLESEDAVSFDVTPVQLRAMCLLGLDSVQSGRPICPKCQLPEDPEGHDCPSANGHRA